jgi:hypothetical protein
MCFNSPVIRAEVRRRGQRVIGRAIRAGCERLRRMGRADLFAGVIVGWETQIGQDFDTGAHLGYHALSNRGFSKSHPPGDLDAERQSIVEEFITAWCSSLAEAGIPAGKIYSHIGFISKYLYGDPQPGNSYSQINHFAPPQVAFGPFRRAGLSTYPQPGLFEQIYSELNRRRNPAWASSEGTNLELGSDPGQSGMNMETYLAKMFNHGATMVNIFAWGLGGPAGKSIPFRVATEGEEALIAYRKFLRGERLVEGVETPSFRGRVLGKVRRIQRELPGWVRRMGNQAQVEPLVRKLDAAIKSGDLASVEKAADEILTLMPSR